MNTNKSFIGIVQDRSGSMGVVRSDVIHGFNSFIEDQKKVAGECFVTLWQFTTAVARPVHGTGWGTETIYSWMDIHRAPQLTELTYRPGGGTPLLDAIGFVIESLGQQLEKTPEAERPARVVIVIMTDGYENSSVEYKGEQGRKRIFEMIRHQTEKYNWQFIFIGAAQDAIQAGEAMGMGAGQIMSAGVTGQAVCSAYSAVSANIADYRAADPADLEKLRFKKFQREAQVKEGAVEDKMNKP